MRRPGWRPVAVRDYGVLLAGALVVLVTLSCICAPLLTRQDPQLLREYLGELPPGATHPDCLDHNRLALGEGVSWCALPSRATTLEVDTEQLSADTYRLVIRRGLLEIRGRGGVRQEQLVLEPTHGQLRAYHDVQWDPAPPITLSWGMVPPPGLFPGFERALAARIVLSRSHAHYLAVISSGRISALTRDGAEVTQPLDLSGETVRRVRYAAPGAAGDLVVRHWMGTDLGGRDLLSRVLHGGRISLMVGAVATAVSLIIGVLYGALSGYLGGRSDRWMMGALEVLYALPFMFIVILLLVYVGNDVFVLFLALGAVQWLTMARIVRGQVLSLMSREFILAARATGVPAWRIILLHLIPNTAGLIAVYTALTVPAVILEESFLSFIGLSVQYHHQSLESWGALVKFGVDALDYHSGYGWWLLVFPAALMVGTLLALNLIGDTLRDLADPQSIRRR